eukprot:gene25144-10776_t
MNSNFKILQVLPMYQVVAQRSLSIVLPMYQVVAQRSISIVSEHPAGKALPFIAAATLLFAIGKALYAQYLKTKTPEAQQQQMALYAQYLKTKTPEAQQQQMDLAKKASCTPTDVFRKYVWYLLCERQFNQEAVDDLIALKVAGGLTDADVADSLKNRAERIYRRHGTLMMNTEGMTASGIVRKATVRNLCSKLLYLAEREQLLAQDSEAAKSVDYRVIFGATEEDMEEIFGATEDDMEQVRITNLEAVDLEALFMADPAAGLISYTSDEEDHVPMDALESLMSVEEGSMDAVEVEQKVEKVLEEIKQAESEKAAEDAKKNAPPSQ